MTRPVMLQYALVLDVIQVMVGTIFNLAKINTVSCMFTATLYFSDSEYMTG